MRLFVLLMGIIFIFANLVCQVIKTEEIELIDKLLEKNDEDLNSLNFIKDWASGTRFKIPLIVDILNNPLRFPKYVNDIDQILQSENPTQILSELGADIYQIPREFSKNKKRFANYYDEYVKVPEDIFSYVNHVWQIAYEFNNSAWQELDQNEVEKLEYFFLLLHQEEEDSLKYENFLTENQITQFDSLEIEEVIPLLEKIKFCDLAKSFNLFQTGFDVLRENICKLDFNYSQKLVYDSPWGRMCIGTAGDDKYTEDYCLLIDPVGNDIYRGNINSLKNNFFWFIDLTGDDLYKNTNIMGLFSVFNGCGCSCDQQGDDVYYSDDFSFSSLFGFQMHCDYSGNDIYHSGLHSIASATFGVSLLMDLNGNDLYSVTEYGEGYAGTLSSAVLADYQGNDTYISGGKYLHAPLAPLDYRSLSQGFGFGVRPDLGGGIGILYDQKGNDHYNGGVYAQGVAYWYALGILIDKQGNDFYDAVYYPQGSGIHLAGGFLFDQEGEDHYHSKHGPGQGAAHDYAVGYLVDREGNDSYSVEGGNGLGLTNSVGIFIDVTGNDSYARLYESNYGHANQARNSASIGIFIDTGGIDAYPLSRCENDSAWKSGTFGFGIDTLMVQQREKVEEMAVEQAVEIDSLAEISSLFAIASEWGVGSAQKRVKKAGEFLLKRDKETAEYIAKNKMNTKNGLVYRAIENYASASDEFRVYWSELLNNSDSLIVKNTISIIGEVSDTTYIDTLYSFLKRGEYSNNVLSALGKMKTEYAVEILKKYRFVESEKTRVIVARGLKNTDSELSNDYLLEMINDESFLVRSMLRMMEKN